MCLPGWHAEPSVIPDGICLCIHRRAVPTWNVGKRAGRAVQVLAAVHKLGRHVGLLQPGSVILAPEAHLVDFSYSAVRVEGALARHSVPKSSATRSFGGRLLLHPSPPIPIPTTHVAPLPPPLL